MSAAIDSEKMELLSLLNAWMKANEEILNIILNSRTTISDPLMKKKDPGEIVEKMDPYSSYVIPITITSGIIGKCFLVFDKSTLSIIIDLIMGGDGSAELEKFDEVHLSILDEVINQVTGALISMLSDKMDRKLNFHINPPEIPSISALGDGSVIQADYKLEVEGMLETRMSILIPESFGTDIVRQIMESGKDTQQAGSTHTFAASLGNFDAPAGAKKAPAPQTRTISASSISKVSDINLNFSVVLGKTRVNVKDLYKMSTGSVLEINRYPDEPAELYVNDRFIGYGEIIVIDDNYGVRILSLDKDSKK